MTISRVRGLILFAVLVMAFFALAILLAVQTNQALDPTAVEYAVML